MNFQTTNYFHRCPEADVDGMEGVFVDPRWEDARDNRGRQFPVTMYDMQLYSGVQQIKQQENLPYYNYEAQDNLQYWPVMPWTRNVLPMSRGCEQSGYSKL